MPKTTVKTVTTFLFSELSESAQEHAISNTRDNFQFDDYYSDNVIDDAKEVAKLFGLDIDDVCYSGFSSQGDGACFKGSYKYMKGALAAVKDCAPIDTELHAIVKNLQDVQRKAFYNLTASCQSTRGNNMRVNVDHSEDGTVSDESEDGIESALQDFAHWIYKSLEREYEYQTSDQSMIDMIANNDYEFDEDGSIA